jgi:hypothetical protein
MGWSLSRLALLVPFAICLACLAISPQAGAALPPQDGEYVNQNTAEGEDALFSLHPITKAVIDTVAGATFAQSVSQPFARTITESATLTASDAARQDYFGISVSLQGDQALVGGLDTGSAYVFAFDGTTWSQQAILVSSDHEVLDEFGYSVSLSGNRALVGAPLGSDAGAAYVFVFDGTSWQQEAKLMASDSETSDAFGYSVSLSGNRALIGTNRSNKSGIAYTFVFDGTTWNQETELIPVDSAVNDGFGKSVSLSGQRALVGSPGAVFSAIGSAYVFAFDGATWNQESKLTASDGSLNDHFGTAVSISGRRALVGASHHATQETGAAYTFVLTGGSWIQEAKLAASDGIANDDFGTSVSLMGKHALIGADDYINGQAGSAYVFTFNGTAWNEQVKLLDSHGAPDDSFGASVSLSGTRVLAGAPQDNVNGGRDVGSALIFDLARRP